MTRVRTMGNVTPIKEEEQAPSLAISKSTLAAVVMGMGVAVATIGAWVAWGPGQGLLAAGIGVFIVGVLLGIG